MDTDTPPPSDPPVNPPADPPVDPPGPLPAPSEAPPALTLPPASKVVKNGTKTEGELVLEGRLREREAELAALQDENRQLKDIPKPKAPPKAKRRFFEGATFFDED